MARQTLPTALQHCIERLEHGIMLARKAAGSEEPEYGAIHLLNALKAVEKDLDVLRAAARRAA
jgi:hypothetical protein